MSRPATRAGEPPLVLGDVDLVRAVGLAGARCVVVAPASDPARFSRHAAGFVERDAPGLLDRLVEEASRRASPPAVLVQSDRLLRLVSDGRERLAPVARLPLAPRALVDAVLDKVRFADLVADHGLDAPRSWLVRAGDAPAGVRFPAVAKPASRDHAWFALMGYAKVARVASAQDWEALAPRLAAAGVSVLLQELVAGGEDRIESHHAYVDAGGEVLAEFTGRKLRTRPAEFGASTALVTTAAEDVRRLGREVVDRLGIRGPVKVDLKRAPDGRLLLLEVNARFTLWAHLGARAGVNLVAVALDDLEGRPRPAARTARPGVRWVEPRQDAAAVREAGGSLLGWAGWAARCEARSGAALDDPMPILRGKLWPRVRQLRGGG